MKNVAPSLLIAAFVIAGALCAQNATAAGGHPTSAIQHPTSTMRGPSASSTIDPKNPPRIPRGVRVIEWNMPPANVGLRGSPTPIFDNGEPLNDLNDPASQLSQGAMDPIWDFNAAAADDFILPVGDNVGDGWAVNIIRVPFTFFHEGFEDATPSNTWTSVIVTVYANVAGPDRPDGMPDGAGGSTNSVASEEVPVSAITELGVTGQCRVCYAVDIPVNFNLAENTKYWLSVIPRYPAPPQTAWCLSLINTDSNAQQGFPELGIAYWTDIGGNESQPLCIDPAPPAQGTIKNVSFQIYGTEGTLPTGACCHDDGTCGDNVFESNCQNAGDRFALGESCGALDPPCTTDLGACCLDNGICQDLAPNPCLAMGGDWNVGTCDAFACPAPNDVCSGVVLSITLSPITVFFDTTNANTEAPSLTACGDVDNDLWFAYQAPCTGNVSLSTIGSSFDTAIAVYGPSAGPCPDSGLCPVADNSELACNDNAGPMETGSYVSFPATAGECFMIRVGGHNMAAGPGMLEINCVPTGSGACCHADNSCEVLDAATCVVFGDVFTPDQPCNEVTCPPPPPCCFGDANNDCHVNELDVDGFVAWLLNPPDLLDPEFCRADVNGDSVIDGLDIQPFLDLAIANVSCLPPCCPGDLNVDGLLDGRDVQGLLDAILNPPSLCGLDFCRADVNGDSAVDSLDADALSALLIAGASCP